MTVGPVQRRHFRGNVCVKMPFSPKKCTRFQERIFEGVPANSDWNFPSKQEELSNL